jgi:hypothetical protein
MTSYYLPIVAPATTISKKWSIILLAHFFLKQAVEKRPVGKWTLEIIEILA